MTVNARLLDLAGVLGADDDDLHPLEVDAGSRCSVRVPSVAGIGLERRHADDREVRLEAGELRAASGRRNRFRAKMLAQAVSV